MPDSEVPASIIWKIRRAAQYGVTTGRDQLPLEAAYLRRCTHLHWRTGTLLMFTRDTGHHSSGWFKNPQFERCLHLSLSFREPRPLMPETQLSSPHQVAMLGGVIRLAPFDDRLARTWTHAILGDAARLSWMEGPKSPQGRENDVRHWRVFCDAAWQPIHPRGEVYSKELTEARFRSWSEIHADPNWLSAE